MRRGSIHKVLQLVIIKEKECNLIVSAYCYVVAICIFIGNKSVLYVLVHRISTHKW